MLLQWFSMLLQWWFAVCAPCATRDPWTVVGDAWLSRCSRGLSRCSRGRMSQPLSFCRILEHWLVCWLAWWRLLADSSRLPASGENRMTANLLGSTDLYGRGGWAGKAMKSNENNEKQWKAMKSNEKAMKSNEKQWKAMKKQWKAMKSYEKQWKATKSNEK